MNSRQNKNLERLTRLALSFSSCGHFTDAAHSSSWFGGNADEKIAIWANNSNIQHGCITPDLALELEAFLLQTETEQTERIILCLDSAGVALSVGWAAMRQVASLIKTLLEIRLTGRATTIALLGEQVGCFGGAFLLAGSCQYVLASRHTQCGVSGPKVIEHLNPNGLEPEANRLFYQSSYRLLNGEVFAVLPNQLEEQKALLLMLERHPLSVEEVLAEFNQLGAISKEDAAALALPPAQYKRGSFGFPDTQAVGCDELLAFSADLIPFLNRSTTQLPTMMGNCEQAFSFINEQRGFSRFLVLTMKILRLLSHQGHKIRIRVNQRGHGASFIALTMMADMLIIEEGSHITPLPTQVVEMFLPDQVLTGQEWHP